MKRRHFLKYTSLASTGLAFAACNSGNLSTSQKNNSSESSSASNVDFGKLEKTYLNLGIIPITESAPLVIAQELGFFARYGLNVSLSKQENWQQIQDGLLDYQLDAAQALYGMPMIAQLGAEAAPMVALMVLNLHGSSITLSPKAWDAGIRPAIEYFTFQEFADSYRQYVRKFQEPPIFATESNASMDYYISRYWLAAMGINPESEVEFMEIPPSQMIYKIQAGVMDAYSSSEPWNQQTVLQGNGFIGNTSQNIWAGHPGNVLATMQAWVDEHPATARALVAAIIEACQFCEQAKNRREVAQIIAQSRYLDTDQDYIEPALLGNYSYGGFDNQERLETIPNFYQFYGDNSDDPEKPNPVNYPWRSHGMWLLTQMIRWGQIEQQDYPKDADEILEEIYPLDVYTEVAEALKIELPSDPMKVEPATVFIDQRQFDPSDPIAYLNNFEIQA